MLYEMPELCLSVMTEAINRNSASVVRMLVSMGIRVRSEMYMYQYYSGWPNMLLELFAIGTQLRVCHPDWLLSRCGGEPIRFQPPFDDFFTLLAAGVDPRRPPYWFTNDRRYDVANIAQRQFELMRLRGLEICVGLQSLRLNALQLCEIMAHMFAPIGSFVPFHKVWAIVTTVKHFKDKKNKQNHKMI